ncbi:MAG: 4-hydroxythreonine-4-phosphate dehydrogenase PdxA, partial [Thermoanaerobaculia bacterium]|nr:4-hydroxythreonine-4-phosphate dehydrogenase PdxA [Thermoanaerobaculia bacterium]
MSAATPILAFTQGDPAGVGPELLIRMLGAAPSRPLRPLLVGERAALEGVVARLDGDERPPLVYLSGPPSRAELDALPAGRVPVLDPVGRRRRVEPGRSGPADAAGALAALDAGIALAREGVVDALVTAPVSKESIARHCDPSFRGHTDHLAAACGLERYGRDYLMAFLAPGLQVALLSTHLPLTRALREIATGPILDALLCLDRHAGGRIAVAGLNPHAGEGGLLGSEEADRIEPAVAEARRRGVDARGPESADSLFARARGGEFDWVLALYHDQGLI